MVTFDDEQTKKLVAQRSALSALSVGAFIITFFCGVYAACLTADMDKNAGTVMAFLIAWGVGLAFLIVVFTLFIVLEKRLDGRVATTLASAMERNKDLLVGDSKITFNATYSGGKITLSRVNSFKEITFDLSGIKKSARVYANFGTRLTQYLEGFYFVNKADGYESIIINDAIGKKDAEVWEIVNDGVLQANAEKNYYIKRGLIK